MWETILWLADEYPVWTWVLSVSAIGAVGGWLLLMWEAAQILDEIEKTGGLH